ncbi:hypothetical protein, partial [Oscillibacter sp. CU971]|uniref:hypothetical protein n=1 Tax=Oscillibacter sp. CU971 TaxID=2780102 RepID=UPI00195791DE
LIARGKGLLPEKIFCLLKILFIFSTGKKYPKANYRCIRLWMRIILSKYSPTAPGFLSLSTV